MAEHGKWRLNHWSLINYVRSVELVSAQLKFCDLRCLR